jgi:hypothetical protein
MLTLELIFHTFIFIAANLVTVISTVIPTITELSRMNTLTVAALELSWLAHKVFTILWLIRTILTILLTITLPPERNAFQGFFTLKFTC